MTTHVSAWFGRDRRSSNLGREPDPGVPIDANRTPVALGRARGWRGYAPVRTNGSRPWSRQGTVAPRGGPAFSGTDSNSSPCIACAAACPVALRTERVERPRAHRGQISNPALTIADRRPLSQLTLAFAEFVRQDGRDCRTGKLREGCDRGSTEAGHPIRTTPRFPGDPSILFTWRTPIGTGSLPP